MIIFKRSRMKIDKLITLSEFVDVQHSYVMFKTKIYEPKDINENNVDNYNTHCLIAYDRIKKYNEFLKQPLKKEMFVNRVPKPNPENGIGSMSSMNFLQQTKDWQAAEKKVIFDCKVELKGRYVFFIDHEEYIEFNRGKTISDLAEKTNGTLTLKNVEI